MKPSDKCQIVIPVSKIDHTFKNSKFLEHQKVILLHKNIRNIWIKITNEGLKRDFLKRCKYGVLTE